MQRHKRIPAGQRTIFLGYDDTTEELRWCKPCNGYRPASEFGLGAYYCKPHQKAYLAAHYDPRASRDRSFRKNYGITLAQYEAMHAAQGGVCASCGRPETHRHTRGKDGACYLAVDHNHATGKVRALLCRACNTALGSLNEDPAHIRALLIYAEHIQQEQAA